MRKTKIGLLRKKAQQGVSLLEVLLAVGLGSIVLSSGSTFLNERVDDVRDQATAQYQKKFANAAERFVNDNFSTIASTLTVGGPPKAYDLTTIRNAGYLNSGHAATNPYRQTPCLVVRRVADGADGTPRLEALATTEGGMNLPERRAPFIAAQGGSYGGFVPATAPTTVQGAYGVWSAPLAAYNTASCSALPVSENHLAYALFFDGVGSGLITDDLLHRNVVPGRPDLNTMNTALNMGGFDVIDAANVYATNEIKAGGDITAGGVVRSTVDDPAYGQTELRRWGLANADGSIYLEPKSGYGVVVTPATGGTNGAFVSMMADNLFMQGHSQFSRDNAFPCCNPDVGTIGVAEATSSTGRKASITFHNAGNSEGTLELANSGSRRLRLYDSQGAGLGLEATRLNSNDYTSTAGETYTGGWFRTTGNGGWYSEAHGGGWYMSNPNWVRSYNNKNVVTGGEVQAGTLTSYSNTNVGADLWMNSGQTIRNGGTQHINANGDLFLQPWSGGITYVGGGGGSGYLNIQGNAEANDIYLRSTGKWLSTISKPQIDYDNCTAINWGTSGKCPADSVLVGADTRGSDSGEWDRFHCCPFK